MSEKHLTELPWKTLVAKQGVKDIGLQKALIAYAKLDATKEPGKALEALKEIAELAVKLKKANPAKEEVVAYLDEVVKEVKKTTPNLEARIKAAAAATAAAPANPAAAAKPAKEEEDEDQEAAEFKKDLKKQLVSQPIHLGNGSVIPHVGCQEKEKQRTAHTKGERPFPG